MNDFDDYVFFFRNTHPLSQWYPSKFYAEGMWFDNAEHFMMWRKARLFGDKKTSSELIICPNPAKAKQLGRQVVGFDENIWNNAKLDIVFLGNLYKFTSNLKLKEYLLSTGDKKLIEASPYDKIWGIGLDEATAIKTHVIDWPGQNLLGITLQKVREFLKRA